MNKCKWNAYYKKQLKTMERYQSETNEVNNLL